MRIAFLALLTVVLMVETLWDRHLFSWGLGLAAGVATCAYVTLHDWAPWHIENWHTGAEAERRTGRLMRELLPAGWHCVHDRQGTFGNLDHVLIGPGGVFLVDSKHYLGRVSVDAGVVTVKRRSNPLATYRDRKVAASLRRAASELSRELTPALGRQPWVQGVVAIWSDFEQRETIQQRVVFLQAEELVAWIGKQRSILRKDEVGQLATVVEAKPPAVVRPTDG